MDLKYRCVFYEYEGEISIKEKVFSMANPNGYCEWFLVPYMGKMTIHVFGSPNKLVISTLNIYANNCQECLVSFLH